MPVPQLLLDALDDLCDDAFKRFKFNLSMNVEKPIPKSHIDKKSRSDTVIEMIELYKEEMAVNITVKILENIHNNNTAEKLSRAYAEERAATSSTSSSALAPPAAPAVSVPPVAPAAPAAPAPPADITADNGSELFAPMVSDGTPGSWNIDLK